MNPKNYAIIDDYVKNNLRKTLTVKEILENCYINRVAISNYVKENEYETFQMLLTDWLEQKEILDTIGLERITKIIDYQFKLIPKEEIENIVKEEKIIFFYIMPEHKDLFLILHPLLLNCRHKINIINSLDLEHDPLYDTNNRQNYVCTIFGNIDPKQLDPKQNYRIIHYSNRLKYENYINVTEYPIRKFYEKRINFEMLSSLFFLEILS